MKSEGMQSLDEMNLTCMPKLFQGISTNYLKPDQPKIQKPNRLRMFISSAFTLLVSLFRIDAEQALHQEQLKQELDERYLKYSHYMHWMR